jgi:hypothetical protein
MIIGATDVTASLTFTTLLTSDWATPNEVT